MSGYLPDMGFQGRVEFRARSGLRGIPLYPEFAMKIVFALAWDMIPIDSVRLIFMSRVLYFEQEDFHFIERYIQLQANPGVCPYILSLT